MEAKLTGEEQAALRVWLETGNLPEQRRARIILLRDEGLTARAIADEVGLSARQARRWLAGFREKRMGIFRALPGEALPIGERQSGPEEPSGLTEPLVGDVEDKPDKPLPPVPATVEELCARHSVDLERATQVRRLAFQIFDLTADIHLLSPAMRALLGTAATLHNLGLAQDRSQRHLVGRDLILAQPIVDLESTEQEILASVVALHRKKVRRHDKAFEGLPSDRQREALMLAALLRVAVGLDASGTQRTSISRSEVKNSSITVLVEGQTAEEDAAAAQRRSRLWRELTDTSLYFMTEGQLAQASLVIGWGWDEDSLPELAAPGLLPDDPMSEAGRKTLWFHFLRMLKHEPGTRVGEDIEELHDMRVATRRMRAAFRVFGDFFEPQAISRFKKGIRRVTRALGPVRDLDVFEEKANHYLETLPAAERNGLDPLLEVWHAERASAREKMVAFLDSERYRKFKRTFADFLQTEGAGVRPLSSSSPVPHLVRHVAPRFIYTRYAAVRAYETVLEDAQMETLHALRIDCKYLRYTLEFLREVLGSEGEEVIKEVKAVQDHLGDLNDADVAIHLLNEFLRDWDATEANVPLSKRRTVEGVVTYLAARHAEKHRLLTSFPEAWDRLNREEVRRRLALAVAAL